MEFNFRGTWLFKVILYKLWSAYKCKGNFYLGNWWALTSKKKLVLSSMWNFWTHFPISLTLCPRLQILSPSNPQNLASGKFQYKSSICLCNKIEGPFHGNACLCSFSLVAKWVAFLSGGTSHIRELVGKCKVLEADMYAWFLEPHHWRLHLGWALLLIWWTAMTTLPSTPPLSPSDIASQIGQTAS